MTKHHRDKDQLDTAPPKSAEEKVKSEPEAQPAKVEGVPGAHGVMAFARRHPLATVLGVAGFGLFGGFEIAAAIMVGAGVAAIVTRGDLAGDTQVVREKARGILARRPELRNRARAVVDAVRGRIHHNGHNA